MSDIITELYYLVDSYLPNGPYDSALANRFFDSLSPEQLSLFEDYQKMNYHREQSERMDLFRYLLSLGLYIP